MIFSILQCLRIPLLSLSLTATLMLMGFQAYCAPLLEIRPPYPEGGGPVKIYSGIQLNSVHAIDSRTESFEADLYFWAYWTDPQGHRLFSKEPKEDVIVTRDVVWGSSPLLWNPNLELNTSALTTNDREIVNILKDGDIGYEARLVGRFHPPEGTLNFRLFPFDSHWLTVEIASFVHKRDKVVFLPHPPYLEKEGLWKITEKVQMQEWVIRDIRWETNEQSFVGDSDDEVFSFLSYKFFVQRKPAYYVFRWMVPLLLILVLAWLALFTPADRLEVQASTVSAAFLSLVALNFVVAGDLPHCEYLTLFDHSLVTAYIAVLIIGIVIFRACLVTKADGDRLFKAVRRSVPLTYLAVNVLGSFLFYIKSPDRNVIAADTLIFLAWSLYVAIPHFRPTRRGDS